MVDESKFYDDLDALHVAQKWCRDGHAVALVTLLESWGSAPRKPGAQLVVNDKGDFMGSVSGGCVENEVITQALDVISSKKPLILDFEVGDQLAWKVGLSCGGRIKLLVECIRC